MNTTRVRDWLKAPDTTAAEKALWVTALMTFFCMALGTAPPLIAGALAAGIWLFSGIAIKKRRIYRSSYWWPVLALILLIWIGMLYTHDTTGIGMEYAGKTYYWLFGLSIAAIPFRCFPPRRLVYAFMLGLGFNVIAAMAQIAFHLPDKHGQHRGLGPDYSTLSAYLIVGIMMGVYLLNREQRTRPKIALAGLIGLYFFHFIILQSRASYVALILLTPFIAYTFFKTRKLLKTASVCILVPCLMMISPVVRDRVATTADQLNAHLHGDRQAAWGKKYMSSEERLYLWHGAVKIIGEHPLLGVGTGGYMTALQEIDNDPDAPTMSHPHNNFLYIAASYGVVGSVVFLWFLVAAVFHGWRNRATIEGYFLLAVFLVMITTGLFNTQILDMGTAFLLSLSIGLQQAFPENRLDEK